jgi:hypothetical protein
MQNASWVVVNVKNTEWREWFPVLADPQPPEKERFEEALNKGFEFVMLGGRLELRHRAKSADASLCAGIDQP